MGTESVVWRRFDRLSNCRPDIGHLEFALKQAEHAVGCESSTDASHSAHLKRLGKQFARRTVKRRAKNVDDFATKHFEIWEMGFGL